MVGEDRGIGRWPRIAEEQGGRGRWRAWLALACFSASVSLGCDSDEPTPLPPGIDELVDPSSVIPDPQFGYEEESPLPRPNIVVVLVDDMGYSDIGAYGGEIETPNLDHLADEGLRLTDFHNAARCWTTRASLLTGLHHHQVGFAGDLQRVDEDPGEAPFEGHLTRDGATIAELLGAAGYRTYMSGKWHVGENPEHWPRKRGFDRFFGLISGGTSHFELLQDHPGGRQMALDDDPWVPGEDFYSTDAFTDYALQFLDQHVEDHPDSPFFLYLSYTAPHWPLHAPAEDIERYEGVYDVGWEAIREARFQRLLELGLVRPGTELPPFPDDVVPWSEVPDRASQVRKMQVHAAMVDRIDQNIGRVLAALDTYGVRDDTLVVFLSDNGASAEDASARGFNDENTPIGEPGSYVSLGKAWATVSNTPFRHHKGTMYAGGTATPFIMNWPPASYRRGDVVMDAVGHVIDLVPTLLQVAKAEYPRTSSGHVLEPLVGRTLAPLLWEGDGPGSRSLFWGHNGHKALRLGPWKLVKHKHDGWALYGLHDDPTEVHDLSETYPIFFDAMRDGWSYWAESLGL